MNSRPRDLDRDAPAGWPFALAEVAVSDVLTAADAAAVPDGRPAEVSDNARSARTRGRARITASRATAMLTDSEILSIEGPGGPPAGSPAESTRARARLTATDGCDNTVPVIATLSTVTVCDVPLADATFGGVADSPRVSTRARARVAGTDGSGEIFALPLPAGASPGPATAQRQQRPEIEAALDRLLDAFTQAPANPWSPGQPVPREVEAAPPSIDRYLYQSDPV